MPFEDISIENLSDNIAKVSKFKELYLEFQGNFPFANDHLAKFNEILQQLPELECIKLSFIGQTMFTNELLVQTASILSAIESPKEIGFYNHKFNLIFEKGELKISNSQGKALDNIDVRNIGSVFKLFTKITSFVWSYNSFNTQYDDIGFEYLCEALEDLIEFKELMITGSWSLMISDASLISLKTTANKLPKLEKLYCLLEMGLKLELLNLGTVSTKKFCLIIENNF